MKTVQELGFALAILFMLIGISAYKHEYKKTGIIFFFLAGISFLLFVIAFVYIF